jgi:hypothetical protein
MENVNYNPIPVSLSKLYDVPKACNYIGLRFALKAKEYSFSIGDYDHLYINLTPLLKDDESRLSERILEKWFRYIDYGYSVEKMNSLDDTKKLEELYRVTKESLIRHCCKTKCEKDLIRRLYKILLDNKADTDIDYRKVVRKNIVVYFIINLLDDGKINLYFRVLNGEKIFISCVNNIFELHYLLGDVRIKKDKMTIIPRKNKLSEMYAFDIINANINV